MEEKRICCKCKIIKTISEFSKDKNSSTGYTYSCKKCRSIYYNNFYKENPDKAIAKNARQSENRKRFYSSEKGILSSRRVHLKRKYKISLEEYNKMSDLQGHKCAICGGLEMNNKNKVLCVDHNHETNKIRGLLCGSCNLALGSFLDKKERLLNAIKYLDKYDK